MYFANISNAAIDVDGSGNVDILKNLTAKAKISNELINSGGYYETISIQDGERPDHLSQRLYGSPEYHWTFLLLNPQIKNIWDDWPMKYSQLIEYCVNKYQYLAADTDVNLKNKFLDEHGKFNLDENVIGLISGASGKLKEIHVNAGYLVIERTSISNQIVTAGSLYTNSWYRIVTTGTAPTVTDFTLIGAANNNVGTLFQATGVGEGTGTAKGVPREFKADGESIYGIDSQSSATCNFIKSHAYAPHHHTDDSTGDRVARGLAGTSPYTFIDYEAAITEQNRNIKVIKPSMIRDVAKQFAKTMNNA